MFTSCAHCGLGVQILLKCGLILLQYSVDIILSLFILLQQHLGWVTCDYLAVMIQSLLCAIAELIICSIYECIKFLVKG